MFIIYFQDTKKQLQFRKFNDTEKANFIDYGED